MLQSHEANYIAKNSTVAKVFHSDDINYTVGSTFVEALYGKRRSMKLDQPKSIDYEEGAHVYSWNIQK